MKRVLLSMFIAGLLFPAIAQDELKQGRAVSQSIPVVATPAERMTLIPVKQASSVMTESLDADFYSMDNEAFANIYDRQSQGSLYDMMCIHDDGFIGATWTVALGGDVNGFEERDIAYACSRDGGETWEEEFPIGDYKGVYWPGYTQWGANGEIIVCRLNLGSEFNGLAVYRRATKGEGEWEEIRIPNPSDAPSDAVLAWHRICSSGENNEYLHLVTGIGAYHGWENAIIYNRSSNGGETWEPEWKTLNELVDQDVWLCNGAQPYYVEGGVWAKPQGSKIAYFVSKMRGDSRILKSENNGDTWTEIMVYESGDAYYGTSPDSGFRAASGHVAFDNNGKLHAVMSTMRSSYNEEDGVMYWRARWIPDSNIIYWNETRGTYELEDMRIYLEDYMENEFFYVVRDEEGVIIETDFGLVTNAYNDIVVGGPIPLNTDEGFEMDNGKTYYAFEWAFESKDWAWSSYRSMGLYIHPQIMFDAENRLHFTYLTFLDGGFDGLGDHQLRQLYYVSTEDEFKTTIPARRLMDNIDMEDQEISYPYLAGFVEKGGARQLLCMAQVDPYAGVYVHNPGTGEGAEEPSHDPLHNRFYAFKWVADRTEGIFGPSAEAKSDMKVYPNPAADAVTVKFFGKANIEVYNTVGQRVYHAENVVEKHTISLQNLSSGIYFVTVRNGNQSNTLKLIVK